MITLFGIQLLTVLLLTVQSSSIYDNDHSNELTDKHSISYKSIRSVDKTVSYVRGTLILPNGTVLHANRHVLTSELQDESYPTAMLRDLLQLPQLAELPLGPIRIGRAQHEPEDRVTRAVIILPDGRRFRGYRNLWSKIEQKARYINQGNLGAYIYENDQDVAVSSIKRLESGNIVQTDKRTATSENAYSDNLYLRRGELGAYIYGSFTAKKNSIKQCSIKENISKGSKSRYLVLHQEPCEGNEEHKILRLADGRKIVYYGELEYVEL